MKSNSSPEHILSMGLYGSGKTHAWATTAARYRESDTPGNFYVLDTDNTTARTLDGFPGWERNVQVVDALEWADYQRVADWCRVASRDDWLVIDSIDKAWEAVQSFFVAEVMGQDIDAFFLDYRKEKSGHPLAGEYGINWTVINRLYNTWMGKVLRFPGHVYACTPSQPVQMPDQQGKGGDSQGVRDLFGRYGVRPSGQKHLGFQFHTVLLMRGKGRDEWVMTSVKDRSRELVVDARVLDFSVNYLVQVGGWTM